LKDYEKTWGNVSGVSIFFGGRGLVVGE